MNEIKSAQKIILIEDFRSMLTLMKRSLERCGYKTPVTFTDAKSSLQYFEKNVPDLIISGWDMPKLTGLELLDFIRSNSRLKHIPFLMVTSRADKKSVLKAIQTGVNGYVLKPFRLDLFSDHVKELLREDYQIQSLETRARDIIESLEPTPHSLKFSEEQVNLLVDSVTSSHLDIKEESKKKTQEREVVLIVDDMPQNIEVISGVLKDEYLTKAATNGLKAIEVAIRTKPDLILLDIMMPDLDGYEVCKQLKINPLTKNIPIIFVSAKTETVDVIKGFDVGAVDYLTKPISPEILKVKIKTHLDLLKDKN